MDADANEIRVLGCLIEKQRTTPDIYPLSLNSLRLACNQATNRDPVVSFDEPTIRAALDRLSRRGWARLASGATSRAIKYRHLLDEQLKLDGREVSLLCVLMLRGPQTPGELHQRCDRLYHFGSLEAVDRTLEELIERRLVAMLPRRPGQKEQRYQHLLSGDPEDAVTGAGEGRAGDSHAAAWAPPSTLAPGEAPAGPASGEAGAPAAGGGGLRDTLADQRLTALEARVGAVEQQLAEALAELDRLR